jgi:hypothetical protein
MKVIEAIWFSTLQGTVGIVVGEDEYSGARKAYLGIGLGFDESQDVAMIKSLGTKLSLGVLDRIRALLIK